MAQNKRTQRCFLGFDKEKKCCYLGQVWNTMLGQAQLNTLIIYFWEEKTLIFYFACELWFVKVTNLNLTYI